MYILGWFEFHPVSSIINGIVQKDSCQTKKKALKTGKKR